VAKDMAEESTARDVSAGEGIALPTPTAWPMLFALGLSMLFAGLVTHAIVSGVGAVLFVLSAVGWWFEVLPHERHERVALQPDAERPAPIEPRTAAVEHLRAGQGRHRLRLPLEIQPYSSGLRGGAAGAVAMAVVAMTYGVIAQASMWYPINLLASAVLPAMNLADAEQLRAFSATALGVATILHGGLSLMVGLVYAALLPALPGRTLLWGGIVAPLAWTGVAWASLGLVAPALNEHIDWRWFIASQAAFGLTAGWVIAKVEPIAVLQRLPLAAKAGIEARGVTAPRSEEEGG
jgi:hypothetical protein